MGAIGGGLSQQQDMQDWGQIFGDVAAQVIPALVPVAEQVIGDLIGAM